MDPNEVVGKPVEREVWLAPDWSSYKPVTQPQPKGWTRVSVRDTTYKDGRIVTQVLDENRKPVSDENGPRPALDTQMDPDTKKAWDAAQDDRKPPGGVTTRTINGSVFQWNPDTRAYDIPTGAAPTTTQTPQEIREEAERKKNASLPKDQDPRSETDAQRAARADATIKAQGEAARQAQLDAERQANTAADNKRADEAAARAAAAANKPSVTLTPDGKGGQVAVITTPDGKVSSVPVPGVQGTPPQVTVQGTTYERQPDGTYKPAAGLPNPNAPIPKGAPQYTPDYNAPDLGLTDFNNQLLAAQQSGLISREQGRQLLETAAGLATQTASHGTTLASQASTTRSQDITQRGQTLGEVQSRRSAADTGFDNAQSTYIGNAAHLGRGHGGIAADAFREALMLRQGYAQQAGGYADVPPVPLSPAIAAVRTTLHPDGTVVHERPADAAAGGGAALLGPPGEPTNVQPAAAPAQSSATPAAAAPATTPLPAINPQTGEPTGLPQPVFNPAPGEPGHIPGAPVGQVPAYLQPARSASPVFDPSPVVAELRQRGFSDAAIAQALDEHTQEMGAAA